MDTFSNTGGWWLKQHHPGTARGWEWEAGGFLSPDVLGTSLGQQSRKLLEGKLSLDVHHCQNLPETHTQVSERGSPAYPTPTPGSKGALPKHLPQCLGCARRHSNHIQQPSRAVIQLTVNLKTQKSLTCAWLLQQWSKEEGAHALLKPLPYCLHMTL